MDSHTSPFKSSVGALCEMLGTPLEDPSEEALVDDASGPPLLALSALSAHLPKIARLEKFDPRDHEATKIARLRAHLRTVYGGSTSPLWLADLFDPEDNDV